MARRTGSPGQRIRQARTAAGVRQADLARSVGISPSYLNLIEHDRRKIGGKVLVRLAECLGVDVALLADGAESQLVAALVEAADDLSAATPDLGQAEELARRFPQWAELAVGQHQRIGALTRSVAELSDRMAHDPQLSASIHEMLSTVTAIQSTSAILVEPGGISQDWQRRFNLNIFDEAKRLADASHGLVRYLDAQGDDVATPGSPQEEVEEWLAKIGWHLPELETGTPPQDIVRDAGFGSMSAAGIAEKLLEARALRARQLPIDVITPLLEQTARPFQIAADTGTSFIDVLRRLGDLPADLVGPLGLVEIDITGAVLFHRSLDGFAVPRFNASCGLWPIFDALTRPQTSLFTQVQIAGRDGVEHSEQFEVYAAAERRPGIHINDPSVIRSVMMIIPAQTSDPKALRVGSTCRICPRLRCCARREPTILSDAF